MHQKKTQKQTVVPRFQIPQLQHFVGIFSPLI
jgi:hypothetical protein